MFLCIISLICHQYQYSDSRKSHPHRSLNLTMDHEWHGSIHGDFNKDMSLKEAVMMPEIVTYAYLERHKVLLTAIISWHNDTRLVSRLTSQNFGLILQGYVTSTEGINTIWQYQLVKPWVIWIDKPRQSIKNSNIEYSQIEKQDEICDYTVIQIRPMLLSYIYIYIYIYIQRRYI